MVLRRRPPHFVLSLSFVLAALGSLVMLIIRPSGLDSNRLASGLVKVVQVYDGDTFRIEGGEKVRLLGIDTPELHESNKMYRDAARSGKDIETIKALGKRARDYVEPLLADRQVRLDFDIERRDRYGRLLAYVYLEDGTFLNKLIIEQGYASPLTIPPNIRYADDFKRLYKQARARHLGLWREVRN